MIGSKVCTREIIFSSVKTIVLLFASQLGMNSVELNNPLTIGKKIIVCLYVIEC